VRAKLDYIWRDLIVAILAIQLVVLAQGGRAWFVVGTAMPRLQTIEIKKRWARFLCAAAAGALLAWVARDLIRKFPYHLGH
jgi:hypothetical protein